MMWVIINNSSNMEDNDNMKATLIPALPDAHNLSAQLNLMFDLKPNQESDVDLISKTLTLQSKFFSMSFTSFFYFTLSLVFYALSHIFIRYESLGIDHFLLPIFHIAPLSLFIPLSFWFNLLSENCCRKRSPKEIEQTSTEMAHKMSAQFSEIMEKKFYENYFDYCTKYYLHAVVLATLYYISLLFYYWGLYLISPLIGNTILASTVLILQALRLVTGNYICKPLSNFILIFYSCGLACLFGFLYNSKMFFMSSSILGYVFYSISAFSTALMIYYYNAIVKRYIFYIDLVELCGFIGAFCLVLAPFFVLLISYLLTEGIRLPSGNEVFVVLGKSMLCSCVNDVLILKCISMFSMSIQVTSLGALVTVLYAFRVIFSFKEMNFTMLVFFGCGAGLMLISFILCLVKFWKGQKDAFDTLRKNSFRSRASKKLVHQMGIT